MRKRTTVSIISLIMVLSMLCSSCASGAATPSAENTAAATGTVQSGLTGSFTSSLEGWITDDEARETVTPSSDEMPSTYDGSLYEFDSGEYESVEIDLSSLSESYNDGAVTVEEKSKKVTITVAGSGKYNIVLTGVSEKGVTVVCEENDYMLTLDGVTITSSADSDEQALKLKSSTTCFVVLSGENSLTGCSGTETNVFKASGALVISGEGSLDVYAVTKNGIVSDDVIVVNGGNINVTLDSTTSGGTGIKPVNGYVQNAGTVTITGLNMTEGMENKGIKVEGDESESGRGKGYVLINGGEIVINTSGKGITAGFDTTEDGDTSSSENDPSADVFINNGLITITTYAAPREDSSADANDGVSPEGIEGKRSVTINGGKIVLNTTDDAINVSEEGSAYIVINGGLIYAHSSANDAVDSNGTITMNGGVLIALGAAVPEGGIDCDNDSNFSYNGGTLIALGGTNNLPQAASSTGYYLYSGMSMNMGGNPPFMRGEEGREGAVTPPEMPGGTEAASGLDGAVTPPEMPGGTEEGFGLNGAVTPPEMPEGSSAMPQGGFGGGFQKNGEAPELPQGAEMGNSEGGFGGAAGSLSAGDTIALLDSDGNVILAFTVPENTVSSSILIASDALREGEYTITKDAAVTSDEETFASSLSLGEVEVAILSSSSVTISAKGTSIAL